MGEVDLYRRLQQHLDHGPVPFPATASGVELRILKRLFNEDDARLALELSAIPESAATIHKRVKHEIDRATLAARLDAMSGKGLIHKLQGDGGEFTYGKAPLVVGFYEAQVDHLTEDLERDVRAYFDEQLAPAVHGGVKPQMRTVPVNQSIAIERPVASYDNIRAFVEASPGPFAVQNCICRQGKDLTGEPCRQTDNRRNCLLIGSAASSLAAKGVAIEITRGEMFELLARADREGLVLQPQNTQNPMFVCCCCGCCCGVLTTAKKLPHPASFFETDFVAEVDAGDCVVCGECAGRCQMEAIAAGEEPAQISAERCIGCGLCVTTCPSGALRLRLIEGRKAPPKDVRALYLSMFAERYGKLGMASALAGHLAGRKF